MERKTTTQAAANGTRAHPVPAMAAAAAPLPDHGKPKSRALSPGLQITLVVMAGIAFLSFARTFVLPIISACMAGMALKPLIRWLAQCHVPRPLGAAIILAMFVCGVAMGSLHLSRPAIAWVNEAPEHMAELKQRLDKFFRPATQIGQVAAAVKDLANTEEDQKKATPVQVKDSHGTGAVINWTGGLLAQIGETLVLLYLLLVSGDLFSEKLVKVSPTLRDKRRSLQICQEIEHNISGYLFSVSLINFGLGICVAAGLYFMGVPNAPLWGMVAALLNYIPYFGPIAGIALVGIVGVLTFDTLGRGFLPLLWYLALHLVEANFITPVLLGRRFTLNPVIIFCSLLFWTWLWGVAGALLSVPILISFKAVCDRLPVLSPVSEFLVS